MHACFFLCWSSGLLPVIAMTISCGICEQKSKWRIGDFRCSTQRKASKVWGPVRESADPSASSIATWILWWCLQVHSQRILESCQSACTISLHEGGSLPGCEKKSSEGAITNEFPFTISGRWVCRPTDSGSGSKAKNGSTCRNRMGTGESIVHFYGCFVWLQYKDFHYADRLL